MSSVGNTNKQVRKFIRECGLKADMSTVERISKEVRRTESQNEAIQRASRETGRAGTFDLRGRDAHRMAERQVRRELRDRRS